MNYQQAINRYKRKWVIGQCLKLLLLIAAIFITAVLVYGLADLIWPMRNEVRSVVNKALVGAACVVSFVMIYRFMKTKMIDISACADLAITNESKTIRAAYDLSQRESSSPLNEYLSLRAQEDAGALINGIHWKNNIPMRGIIWSIAAVLMAAGIGYGIRGFQPAAYDTVANRLIHPERDIPPYSPLKFNITQDSPSTVYGADNQVRVEITGGELKEDVICRVRDKITGEEDTISTFQESSNLFSKKFTNVLSDIEYSFSTGKARSEWHTIKVLLQPKFTNAVIKVTPPSYTKRKPIEFPFEGNELSIINGSKIELSVSSNRPLNGGEIIVKPEDASAEEEQIIEGEKDTQDEKKVTFSWVASKTAKISCSIKDLRNTPAATSLDFSLLTRADLAPVAELTSPAKFVLATPNSIIPLEGNVQDDFEVDSVYLVRTLVGFRDRAKELASAVSRDLFRFEKELDLKALGVEPNQILELYLEANDKNPSLLGLASSDVVRVQIISEADYAKMLRDASDWKEFNARFRIVKIALQNAITSLKKLSEVNKVNQDADFLSERDAAKKVHQNSREIVMKIAKDFNAYAMEEKLTEIALDLADKLLNNDDQLTGLVAGTRQDLNEGEIREMLERLGSLEEIIDKLDEDAESLKKWAAVGEQAAIFKKLYNQQFSIANKITKIAQEIQLGENRNAPLIQALGQTQQLNKKDLLKFAEDLKRVAADLPAKDADLKGDCEVWLGAFKELNIPIPMDAATKFMEQGKSHDAATEAHLASTLMKQLIDMKENEFAAMIRNERPKDTGDEKLNLTKEQLLDALHNQLGGKGGEDEGEGGGEGGVGQQGGGKMQRNQKMPMFGPERNRFGENDAVEGKGKNDGEGNGKGKGNNAKVSENNSIKSNQTRDTNTSQTLRTNIPEKYKDAVKRFYSDPEK